MARSKVWDGTNWVYQNTVVHSGGGSGSSTSIITSWDDLPQNPSIGDRATNINDNASSGTNYLLPQVIITAPIGTQITVTNNITTYTTTAISTTSKVNVNDYGEWTVTMVSGDETIIQTVIIDAVKQYFKKYTKLPDEYQEVEYIQSDGTQYIDTQLYPNSTANNAKLEIKYTPLDSTNASARCGVQPAGEGYWLFLIYMDSGINSFVSDGIQATPFETVGTPCLVTMNAVNGIATVSEETSSYSTTFNYSTPIYANRDVGLGFGLFGRKRRRTGWSDDISTSSIKLYYCKMYSNGELIGDLIPCYRKLDSVIGLYDVVNERFLVKEIGNNFIKGGNV